MPSQAGQQHSGAGDAPERADKAGPVDEAGGSLPAHPWLGIGLDVYERHMSDPGISQLRLLHEITRAQLDAYPARALAVLGVAGGNGLDLIDPDVTDAVFGYDINAKFLAACESRFRGNLADRLHLIETTITRSTRIERVDLVIANLIIEYIGAGEFVAFAASNADRVGVLSCVTQSNDGAPFISFSNHTSTFDGLASVSAEIDPDQLHAAMRHVGFNALRRYAYPLPNGKAFIRQDFRATSYGPEPTSST